jgi:integrase
VKKIAGRIYAFGVLDDPMAALRRYQMEGPALHAGLGRTRRQADSGMGIGRVVALFLQSKQAAVEAGDLDARTYRNYEDGMGMLLELVGTRRPVSTLGPLDFERMLRKLTWGPTRRTCFVTWVKMLFSWAVDAEVIEAVPRYGKAFRGSPLKERRLLRHRAGENWFTAEQVRQLLDVAGPKWRAMILLGVNGGLGNTDIARLTWASVDLAKGMLNYPRHKTGVARLVPLWPETIEAMQAVSPGPEPAGLVFRTRFGLPWIDSGKDCLSMEFGKLLRRIGVRRRKVKDASGQERTVLPYGYYTLRRTFRTVADEVGDQHAVHLVTGHVVPGMAGLYVQRIGLPRLRAVVDHVRAWLWAEASCPWPRGSVRPPVEDHDAAAGD